MASPPDFLPGQGTVKLVDVVLLAPNWSTTVTVAV
jgi:hypothetical protein